MPAIIISSSGDRQHSDDAHTLTKLAEILSKCGEAAIYHFLKDLHCGRNFDETVTDYCRLNPVIYGELLVRMNGTGGPQ